MLLSLVNKNFPHLTIEEAALQGGFGSAYLEFASDRGFHHVPIERMGIPDRFIEHGSVDLLLQEIGLTVENAVAKLKSLTKLKQKRA